MVAKPDSPTLPILEAYLKSRADDRGYVTATDAQIATSIGVCERTVKRLLAVLRSRDIVRTRPIHKNIGNGNWLNKRTIIYRAKSIVADDSAIKLPSGLRLTILETATRDFHNYHRLSMYRAGKAADDWYATIPSAAFENLPSSDLISMACEVMERHPLPALSQSA
jgi:hypothetical protein